ncbi:MAG: DNA replication/repair protein RecF [Muribaculaceae bacterium]|nr:DNA replication/repair protein RecF [Muribaculaceae bacterium]
MILQSIALTNFKNIASAALTFSPKINCLLGDNGMGKSNLLDAIHFLSFTKSYGRLPDSMLIRRGEDYAILRGRYVRGETEEEITAGLRRGGRKSLKRGGKEYGRLSAHVGLLPAVMVAPPDLSLVTESGEERRRFADMIISQTDRPYLDSLMLYNRLLEQRNKLLRDESTDATLYESIELMMDQAASVIVKGRRRFVDRLRELFADYYRRIAGSDENVDLSYEPSVDGSMLDALEQVRRRDAVLHHTSVGPHRDDIVFTIDGMPLKAVASQGQTKTFTIALRLAQYDFLAATTTIKPLLLLDDIFDKLDARRVERIVDIVSGDSFGQIFITDTNRKHLDEIMDRAGRGFSMWHVADGSYTPIGES